MQGHFRNYLTLKAKELRSVEVYGTVYPNSVSSQKSWILRRKGFFFCCKIFHGQGDIDRISKHFSNRVQVLFLHDWIIIATRCN